MENTEREPENIPSFSKDDQIEIILNDFNDERLYSANQGAGFMWGDIAKSLNVTESDVLDYVKNLDGKRKFAYTSPDSRDGVYILEENGVYVYFNQERGMRSREKVFDTYDEAVMDLVNDKIKSYLNLKK